MIAGQNSGNLNTIRMDFTVRRYDTFSETFNIEYYNSDGILTEVDLTSAFAQMWVKKKKTDTTPVLVMDVNITLNEITISKDRSLMKLARGNYYHDIEVKNLDGDHITWIEGRFIVLEHVTEYIDEHLNEYYIYFTNLLSFLDVPKKILRSTFESIISFLPDVPWILYPSKYIFQTIITFMDQLRLKFKTIFSNIIVISDSKKLKYSIGWSMLLTDSTSITWTGDQAGFTNVLSIYRVSSIGGVGWNREYDSSDIAYTL